MRGRSGVSSGSVCCRGRFGLGQRVNHGVKGESSASTRCCLMFEYVCFLGREEECWIDCGQFVCDFSLVNLFMFPCGTLA